MRVLQFGKYFHKDGGIETHVKTLCKGLAASGVEVVNLVSASSNKRRIFLHNDYTVLESPSFGTCFNTSMAPVMPIDAVRLHAERPFNIIHLHFPDPMSHLASMALPGHIPRVITWHSDIIEQSGPLKLYRPFQRRIIFKCEALVAATASHFSKSRQIPESFPHVKRHVIPYGFDFSWLTPTASSLDRANQIRALARGRFIIFALGRHVAYKGFDVLIDAMKYTQAFLVLGGEGPLTKALRAHVYRLGLEQKVHITGRLQSLDVAAYYQACDAFCLPSITPNEAFGIVQVEAMALGKPVICTQLQNGVNEVNQHGITGLSVEANNPIALADGINHLARNPLLCKQLGVNGQRRTIQKFTASTMVRKHLTLYTDLIQ